MLDYLVNIFFKKSQFEASYANLRLQPLVYQDDLARSSLSAESAQAGNNMIETCMETKLLDLHGDKSCYVLVGNKKSTAEFRNNLTL